MSVWGWAGWPCPALVSFLFLLLFWLVDYAISPSHHEGHYDEHHHYEDSKANANGPGVNVCKQHNDMSLGEDVEKLCKMTLHVQYWCCGFHTCKCICTHTNKHSHAYTHTQHTHLCTALVSLVSVYTYNSVLLWVMLLLVPMSPLLGCSAFPVVSKRNRRNDYPMVSIL